MITCEHVAVVICKDSDFGLSVFKYFKVSDFGSKSSSEVDIMAKSGKAKSK